MGLGGNDYNNINNVNANDNYNNNGRARANNPLQGFPLMKTYRRLYKQLYSWDNLEYSYRKARLHKTGNPKIQGFDKKWRLNLCILMRELRERTYTPTKLTTFILRDPKTRKICVSEFRDRIVHHALVNILQPIFESRFIYDSYASRKGKGTLEALDRFDEFKRKVAQKSSSGGGRTQASVCTQGRYQTLL